jgi:hypothetical protein
VRKSVWLPDFAQIFRRAQSSSSGYSCALPPACCFIITIFGSVPWIQLCTCCRCLVFRQLHLDYPQISVEAQGFEWAADL